jgi:hypothetical protein
MLTLHILGDTLEVDQQTMSAASSILNAWRSSLVTGVPLDGGEIKARGQTLRRALCRPLG